MHFRWLGLSIPLLVTTLLLAQSTPQPQPAVCVSEAVCTEMADSVAKQFGPDLKPLLKYPPMVGDLDGDGQEDVVVVATGNPMGGENEFQYKVADPYHAYFGWGPSVTSTFEQMEPGPRKNILIVHGWKLPKPKAKFIIINLPFEKLSLRRISVKKKTVSAITAQETSSLVTSTYWDGKKYRWQADYTAD